MNRLAVSRSARAQKAHKVNNRINRLMHLHKTDTDTQTSKLALKLVNYGSYQVLFRSRQTDTEQTHMDGR